jgi:preprotein translocase subunit YajC
LSSSSGMLIIYVVAFIAIFYFMAIRPQQRQRKAHQALLSSLKKGDRIITASGIYGTVKRVDERENVVVVEVSKGVTIKIARTAVGKILDQAEARATAPEGPTRGRNAPAEIEPADEPTDDAASGTNGSEETDDGNQSSQS